MHKAVSKLQTLLILLYHEEVINEVRKNSFDPRKCDTSEVCAKKNYCQTYGLVF